MTSEIEIKNTRKKFGIKFIKVEPTTYLLQYRRGRVVREGVGLSFFYYAATTSLMSVPRGSADVPFIFEETTGDFQTMTLQGQVTYRVADPKKPRATIVKRGYRFDGTGLDRLAEELARRCRGYRWQSGQLVRSKP